MSPESIDQFEADCNNCNGFCCVALHISEEFPAVSDSEFPCRNLCLGQGIDSGIEMYRCRIFDTLTPGLQHCKDYTCYGAGPFLRKVATKMGFDWGAEWPRVLEKEYKSNDRRRHNNMCRAFIALSMLFGFLANAKKQNEEVFEIAFEAAEGVLADIEKTLIENEKPLVTMNFLDIMRPPIDKALRSFSRQSLAKLGWG